MKSKLIYGLILLLNISCIVSCEKQFEPSASVSEQATPTIDICATNESHPATEFDFQEIRSTLSPFFREENYQELIDTYKTSIQGTRVEHWEGWVQDTDQIWQREPVILIDMDDFMADVQFPVVEYQAIRRTGLPDVILTNVPSESWEDATKGHRFAFSGVIKDITVAHYQFDIDPASGTLAVIIEMSDEPEKNQATDLLCSPATVPQTMITLTEPICSMLSENCSTIGITIFGDGTVIHSRRDWGSDEMEVNYTTIEESAVNRLTDLANQLDYFSWEDDYDSEDISEASSTTTSITLGDIRKSIFHYHGDSSAPAELAIFENAIMQAVGMDRGY